MSSEAKDMSFKRENHVHTYTLSKHSTKTRKTYTILQNKVLICICNQATYKMKDKQLLF